MLFVGGALAQSAERVADTPGLVVLQIRRGRASHGPVNNFLWVSSIFFFAIKILSNATLAPTLAHT